MESGRDKVLMKFQELVDYLNDRKRIVERVKYDSSFS